VKRVEKPKTKPKPAKPAPQELEAVPPPKLETPAKRLTCPPGFVPGPLGKRCIRIVPKDLTTPKLRTSYVQEEKYRMRVVSVASRCGRWCRRLVTMQFVESGGCIVLPCSVLAFQGSPVPALAAGLGKTKTRRL
jgi:hypothetical protein